MTTAPDDAPAPADGGWWSARSARARHAAQARLGVGTRQRAMAVAARDTYRAMRQSARAVRATWTAPGVVELPAAPYPLWLRAHQATPARLREQRHSAQAQNLPEVAIVILPGAGDPRASLHSVFAQSSPRWRLLLAADAVPDPPVADARVDVAPDRQSPGHAVDAWLAAAGSAPVVLLRAGDLLAPDCAYEISAALHRNPTAELVTWDDDVRAGGLPAGPRFRPSWSPELLLAEDYPGRAFALRAARLLRSGGIGTLTSPAAHWDLLLRAALATDEVTRVPRALSSVPRRDPVPAADARATVQSHLDRAALPGIARSTAASGVRVEWTLEEWPSVTVVIPTRHNRPMLSTCLPSLARSDYPTFDVVVVDNGSRSPQNEQWYADLDLPVPVEVRWWDEPFNFSAVNNTAVAGSSGQVLVFLNDDTEILDPSWLRELVGWAVQPASGVVGLQLLGPDGRIQHEGVVLGMGGFADHVFEGMLPGSDSVYGPTGRLRDVLAVTGACCAIRREVFTELGGFDERFVLCGSDVALGLSAVLSGRRNICSPHASVRHLESATRGTTVPVEDYYASYWRYNSWLFRGDPYWNPNLSLRSRRPQLRARNEPTAAQRVGPIIGRDLTAFKQRNDDAESRRLADVCRLRPGDVEDVRRGHAAHTEPFDVRTVNWFIPDIDSPFYGGINTALRIADQLAREHGVQNRFIVWGAPPDGYVRSALAAAFPSLAGAPIAFYDQSMDLADVPPADAGIATLWTTAYALARAPEIGRKFYLVQDFEPMFYPAGTQYALAEETYRMGFYGLCNTENLRRVYEEDYGGRGMSFTPAVDRSVFHAGGRPVRAPGDPVTVFVYARPGHWRNCWELAAGSLTELKRRLGDGVRIVTAGARATGGDADLAMEHLGLLDVRATGDLYRRTDVGLALTVSKHPSYLPLELMACGVPVVAFDNPWGHWLLRDGENSLLSRRTVDSLADQLERLCRDAVLREDLAQHGLADIAARHADWPTALSGIYGWLCDPEGRRR